MKLIEDKKILIGFSDAGDGDLSFYNMTDEKVTAIWKELAAVKHHALSLPTYGGQVHRDHLITVTSSTPALLAGEADGLITDSGRPVGVFSADCLPLIIYNDRVVAAVHAGWRSTCLNIARRAVEGLTEKYGAAPGTLKAWIGPCINQCCLEMGEEVYQQFVAADPAWSAFFVKKEKWHLDLRGLNRYQLKTAGIGDTQINDVDECTFCKRQEYFSFRRQRQRNGSMFSFVVRRE